MNNLWLDGRPAGDKTTWDWFYGGAIMRTLVMWLLFFGAAIATACHGGGDGPVVDGDCWTYPCPGGTDNGPGQNDNGGTDNGSTEPDNGPVCEPKCAGKTCGPDGCGWSCGNCVEGTWCSSGTCVPFGCQPNCGGKVCGDNGCGGSCGNCAEGTTCQAGKCVEITGPSSEGTGDCKDDLDNDGDGLTDCDDPGCFGYEGCQAVCTPNCVNRVCGNDGCGGSCGMCGTGLVCNNVGNCVISNPSSEGTSDCKDDLDNDGDGLTDCSDPGCYNAEACQEQCDPNCVNRICGADGCGGSCGNCSNGYSCNSVGQCISNQAVYTLTCRFTGYLINMTDPTVKLSCPRIWSFTALEMDLYGKLPWFARNTGTTDGTLETTTKSLSMHDQPWVPNSDPSPSDIFAIVNGEAAGVCNPQYYLQLEVIIPAGSSNYGTGNCGN